MSELSDLQTLVTAHAEAIAQLRADVKDSEHQREVRIAQIVQATKEHADFLRGEIDKQAKRAEAAEAERATLQVELATLRGE